MFLDAEREQYRALFEHEDDLSLRLVLADALLERGEPLGELIRLAVEGHPSADAKARALVPQLARALYPGATDLAFDRGLPFAAQIDVRRAFAGDPGATPAWPLRWATIPGDTGALAVLRLPLFADLERLDLSGAWFSPQFTMFVSGTPAPVPRLSRLQHLVAPAQPPQAHWRPLLVETFDQATTLSLPLEVEDLSTWLTLVPRARRLDLAVGRGRLAEPVRAELLRWVRAQPDRELALSGVTVSPARFDELLAALGPALPPAPLADVSDPPTSRVTTLALHGELAPHSDLFDATLDGSRGTWVRLQGDRRELGREFQVQQDLRLLMMAPLRAGVAGGKSARKSDDATWVLLGEGLRPLGRPGTPAAAVRAALELGEGLEALAGFVTQHTARRAFPWPLRPADVLVGSDGRVRVLPPRQTAPVPDGGATSLGFPTRTTTWSLALFLAAVLVEWLTGHPLAPVTVRRLRAEEDWAEWERLTRLLETPRLPPGLPPRLVPLLAQAFSTRHEERPTLPGFLAGLRALQG